jgi:hypothetical protein
MVSALWRKVLSAIGEQRTYSLLRLGELREVLRVSDI